MSNPTVCNCIKGCNAPITPTNVDELKFANRWRVIFIYAADCKDLARSIRGQVVIARNNQYILAVRPSDLACLIDNGVIEARFSTQPVEP